MGPLIEHVLLGLLGGLFLHAASSKVVDASPLERTLRALGVPRQVVGVGARLIPLYEIALSLAVLGLAPPWLGASFVIVAAVGIGAAGLAALLQAKEIPCSCFSVRSSGVLGMRQLVTSIMLVAGGVALAIADPRPGFDEALARLTVVSLSVALVHLLTASGEIGRLMGYRRAAATTYPA